MGAGRGAEPRFTNQQAADVGEVLAIFECAGSLLPHFLFRLDHVVFNLRARDVHEQHTALLVTRLHETTLDARAVAAHLIPHGDTSRRR